MASTAKSSSVSVRLKETPSISASEFVRVDPVKPPQITYVEPPIVMTTGSTVKIGMQHFPKNVMSGGTLQVTIGNSAPFVAKARMKGSTGEIKSVVPTGVLTAGTAVLNVVVTNGPTVVHLNATVEVQSPPLIEPVVSPSYGAPGIHVRISQANYLDWYTSGTASNDISIRWKVPGSADVVTTVLQAKAKRDLRVLVVQVPTLPVTEEAMVMALIDSPGQVGLEQLTDCCDC